MSQSNRASQDESIPSSFPMSSPSFWNEAATVPTPPLPVKRPHSPADEDDEPGDDDLKRARRSSGTTLSYLPNRTLPMETDDPHGYLANAEYAPNRFGDIGDYMRKKEIKVQTQNRDIALASAAAGLAQIFTGLSFYMNGNTHPPMEDLRKMILQRGGEVRPVLRSKGMVKFIIAPILTLSKFKQFANYRVVREGWIVESCKEGKLLDWSRWKLQVQGGWEETGRKGMEGFLNGTQMPRTPKKEVKEEEEVDLPSSPTPVPTDIVTPTKATTISSRSLLAPVTSGKPFNSSAATLQDAPLDSKPDLAETKEVTVRPITPPERPITSDYNGPPAGYVKPSNAIGVVSAEKRARNTKPPQWMTDFAPVTNTNEDAARLMKNQEWRLKNTAERGNEGGFIDGYYQNSRLHHLSTWKAELKVLVAAAQHQSEELSLTKPSSTTLSALSLSDSVLPRAAQPTSNAGEKVIFHVDFDCFFVSCGLATRPHLKGKPSVVCHSQVGRAASSTSEVASASYEARAKGVKNGMSLGKARTLVGDALETIPYEFETYKKFSLAFYTVLMGYADELQAVSVDEALIDVTSAVAARALAPDEAVEQREHSPADGLVKIRDPAVEIAEKIRDEVRILTDGCEVSIGISHNVLLAKLATRRAKPAGVYHLLPEVISGFLAPLDVEDFPSIGYSIKAKIKDKFGTSNVEELLAQPKSALQKVLGPKTGEMLFGYMRGVDERKLEPHKERKSISAEMNYGIRFRNQEQAEICITDLAAEVAKRMKQVNARGRLLTLKLMQRHPEASFEPPKFLGHGWCDTFNKSTPISNKGGSATDDPVILGLESVKLLRAMRLDPVELRGVGIQITKLDGDSKAVEREAGQGTLIFGAKKTVKAESETLAGTTEVDTTPFQDEPTRPRTRSASASAGDEAASPRSSPLPEAIPPNPVTLGRTRSAAKPAEAGPSRIPISSDGIDPEYLAALPPDLRLEVKRNFARTRGSTEVPPNPQVRGQSPDRETTVSPIKNKGLHATAHITKQLRPKVKTHLKASEVADLPLYGAWSKAKGKEVEQVDLTADADERVGAYFTSELKELGIDPGVFRELPEDMQKEIVVEERKKHRQRKILHRPADDSRARARERESTRTASISPRKARGDSAVPIPRIAVSRPPKPSLLKATALPDVLETVTKWIESRNGGPPAEKDAGKVKTYLVKCMEEGSGLGGIENATQVLRWMRTILLEVWDPEELELREGGRLWWITWRGMRDAVEEKSLERFGAGVRI